MTFTVVYDADKDLGVIKSAVTQDETTTPEVRQEIQFQHGPIQDNGPNGVQNEEVILLLTTRLRELNARFPCRENSIAITKLEEAMLWLRERTRIREQQGVEGKNLAHVS